MIQVRARVRGGEDIPVLFANELLDTLQATTIVHAFVYGFLASLAAELALFAKAFGPRGAVTDKKYVTWLYWVVRVLLALLAGVIASAAYSPGLSSFVYVYLGISTPGLLNRGASYGEGLPLGEDGEGSC